MGLSKHNPYCKLISKFVYDGVRQIEFVYGKDNVTGVESLEAYYYKLDDNSGTFYRSYYWNTDDIPENYIEHFEDLKIHEVSVPEGYKLSL